MRLASQDITVNAAPLGKRTSAPALLAIVLALSGQTEAAFARQRVVTLPDRLEACIQTEIKDYNSGQACIGRHSRECLRIAEQQETMLPEPCYREEETAWIVLIQRYFAQRPGGSKGRRLAAAQRAWTAFRDAKCGAVQTYLGGSLGRWQSSMCRMEEAGRQALHLRIYRAK